MNHTKHNNSQSSTSTTNIKPTSVDKQKPHNRFWHRLTFVLAGVLLVFAYQSCEQQAQITQHSQKYLKPAQEIVTQVMKESESSIDQVINEVDYMMQRRAYRIDDFVSRITSYSFAKKYSDYPSQKLQDVAIDYFKRDVVSEQEINGQIAQAMVSYRHHLNLTQDELVDRLETVFITDMSDQKTDIKQEFKQDFSKLAQLSVATTRITLPRMAAELVVDLTLGTMLTAAIETVLISAGVLTGSGIAMGVASFGIGILVAIGIGAISDALDDSDDKLAAEAHRILNGLRAKVKANLRKQLKQDLKQKTQEYISVVKELARDKAWEDIQAGRIQKQAI